LGPCPHLLSVLAIVLHTTPVVNRRNTSKMHYPSWLIWYKKPSYVDVNEFANRIREKAEKTVERSRSTSRLDASRRSSSESSRSSCDVPTKLSLDRILRNKPCMRNLSLESRPSLTSGTGSPMSLYDFYMYLKYIEHSPENLEFYVWYVKHHLCCDMAY